jgi:hypothetical protein
MLLSPIQANDPQGELIRMAALIICDEAPMGNKAVLACVDETCQRVMQSDELFGTKVVILSGDFQQTCPVIRRGSKAQIIDASIRSWPFWDDICIYRLMQSHASNFSNTSCCSCNKGEVYILLQSFTSWQLYWQV